MACINWKQKLLPTITTDESGQVLMLAYSSDESLKRTIETGNMWYYSRSRDRLWMKGETSGNTQKLLKVRLDCDRDTLLATVKPCGPSCHRGDYSCFGRKRFTFKDLSDVVIDRLKHPVSGSYTATLSDEALRQKVLEEAGELVNAQAQDEVVWEAADLLYFTAVLIAKRGVAIDDVLNELRRRRFERKTRN
jgi:phosphoribosyl-ATP pyrophosphohydrolase/phosphoribosyl-AMP cyclohydrolase